MSKVITSKIKKWAGSVTIADPLTLPQVELIEAAFDATAKISKDVEADNDSRIIFLTAYDKPRIPAILACVEKWELENFALMPDGGIPMSPRRESYKLIEWLFGEIRAVYLGELEIPNESSPTPTATQAADATPEKLKN